VECGGHINGDDGVPAFGWKIFDGRDELNPSVVHQDIHAAQPLLGVADQFFATGSPREVGAIEDCLHTEIFFQTRAQSFNLAWVAKTVHHDGASLSGERTRNSQPNTTGRTRNDGSASFQHKCPLFNPKMNITLH
jgi:hypothetical protein